MCKPQYFMLFVLGSHNHKKDRSIKQVPQFGNKSFSTFCKCDFYFRTVCAHGLSVCFFDDGTSTAEVIQQ
jgi:hypothetical protein